MLNYEYLSRIRKHWQQILSGAIPATEGTTGKIVVWALADGELAVACRQSADAQCLTKHSKAIIAAIQSLLKQPEKVKKLRIHVVNETEMMTMAILAQCTGNVCVLSDDIANIPDEVTSLRDNVATLKEQLNELLSDVNTLKALQS